MRTRFDILEKVVFRAEQYGEEIARILAPAGGGMRRMPLVKSGPSPAEALQAMRGLQAPDSVRAGLYLNLACWEEAHTTADSVENPDGYFWHAIVHRQEPDPANSAYWFRMTGAHPVFPRLAAEAADSGYPVGQAWDPFAFIGFCEAARRRPGSDEEQLAMTVQQLEWQLLLDHCARGSAF